MTKKISKNLKLFNSTTASMTETKIRIKEKKSAPTGICNVIKKFIFLFYARNHNENKFLVTDTVLDILNRGINKKFHWCQKISGLLLENCHLTEHIYEIEL